MESAAPPAAELVLVTIANAPKDESGLAEQIVSLGPQLKNSPVPLLSSDPLPTVEIEGANDTGESSQTASEAGDPAVRAQMFGIYSGQISARIERIWRRPRSPVNDAAAAPPRDSPSANASDNETFSCRVQIRQDSHGNVQEVLLIQCNGTEAWRHSLVIAINQASPLPAPPIPTVFTHALTLTFEGHAYTAKSLADEYEMEPRPSILTSNGAQQTRQPEKSVTSGEDQ